MRIIFSALIAGSLLISHAQEAAKDSLILSLNDAADDSSEIAVLNALAKEYLKTDLDTSRLYVERSLEMERIKELPRLHFEALNLIGNYYQRVGHFDSARMFYEQLSPIAEQLEDDKAWSTYYNNVGIIFTNLSKLDSALLYYQYALDYEISLRDSTGIAEAYNNIGVIHFYSGNTEKCLEYITRSIEVQEMSKGPYAVLLKGYNNLGAIYQHYQKNYDSAFKYYDKARMLSASLDELRDLSITLNNLSALFQIQGDLDMALDYSKQSYDIRVRQDNQEGMVSSLINMSTIEQSRNAYDHAGEYLDQALAISEEIGSNQLIMQSHVHLSGNFELKKDFERALFHARQQIMWKDSLFNETKDKTITELETKYETEKKEQQIALQEAEIARQDSVNERNTVLLTSAGGLILLLIALGALVRSRLKWKNRQLREQQQRLIREAEINAVISSQEKERSRFARDLHDGFGQLISTLNLNLKNMEETSDPSERVKVFDVSTQVLDDMYSELKNICFDLMPQTLIKQGLEPALKEFANRINVSGQKHVEVNVFGIEDRLTELEEISLYRISQEWTNNVIKYSDAENITVQVTRDEGEITLLIEDDGVGFDKEILLSGKGNGWKNMSSRANLVKGQLDIETLPGQRRNALILNMPVGFHEHVSGSTLEEIRD